MVTRFGNWLLPNRRPMDNMKAGWALPQEDEFALMNLGAPTPYLRMMFPNEPIPNTDTLDSERFTSEHLIAWRKEFEWFLKALTYKTNKQLLLKSPPHTGRIGILHKIYPEAKFIHIVRDPRKLFPSTMKLWNSLDEHQALQAPTDQIKLQQFVIESLQSMYNAFERDRKLIPQENIIDVHYEEFVTDPVETLESIYNHLRLGDLNSVREQWSNKAAQEQGYQPNKLQINQDEESMILEHWGSYARRYGYLTS